MKKLLLLLTTIVLSLTSSAQDWTVTTSSEYKREHVIYATFDGLYSGASYVVGAFIKGECRDVQTIRQDVETGAEFEPVQYAFRVKGSESEQGQAITFKVYDPDFGYTYTLTKTLDFIPEGTTGAPSNLYDLGFKQGLYYTYTDENVTLVPGETYTISYTVGPEGGQLPDGFDDWFYANPIGNVNCVSVSGRTVTAEAAGEATIGNEAYLKVSNELKITVVEQAIPVESITINQEYETTFFVGQYEILDDYYTVNPANATNKKVTFSMDNDNMTIEAFTRDDGSTNYIIEAKKKGTTVVTIKSVENPEISATITFNIIQNVESIIANPDANYTINVGDVIDLNEYYTILPEDAYNQDVQVILLSPNDEYFEVIDNNTASPRLKAIKKGDKVKVYVMPLDPNYIDGIEAALTFTILQPVTEIIIEPGELNITVGQEISYDQDFFVIISPDDADNRSFELSSSNPEIAEAVNSIARSPYIKGIAKGTAIITVAATDGSGVKDTFTVNVYPALTGLEIQGDTDITMYSQSTHTIIVKPVPEDAYIDESLFEISIAAPSVLTTNAPSWKYVETEIERVENEIHFTVSAYAMGEGKLTITYPNNSSNPGTDDGIVVELPIHVGFEYTMYGGWNWMSVFSNGSSDARQSMEEIFGNSLIEARTQMGLLYNDPVYGYYGDFTDFAAANRFYMIKIDEDIVNTLFNIYGAYNNRTPISLIVGWNWIPYNCEYDQTISLAGNEGDVILSLNEGFATYTDGAWAPASFKFRAGQGYLYYTNTARSLTLPDPYKCEQPTSLVQAPVRDKEVIWNYNPRIFSTIMPIIAEIEGYDSDNYTVGAFVGEECRGEGRLVDGKWFITVAGENNEEVSFLIYNMSKDEYINVETTVKMTSILGSAKNPVKLVASNETTSISTLGSDLNDDNDVWYNLQGHKVNNPHNGLFIHNGKKVFVK